MIIILFSFGRKTNFLPASAILSIEIRQAYRILAFNSRHFIYTLDLVVDFDSYYNAVEADSSPEGSLVDYSLPRWHRLKQSGRRVFLPSFTEGEAVNDLYLKYGYLSPGDVVFDLGANCGLAAMDFSPVVGKDGLIISLEPDPANFDALQKNLAEYNIKNVRALNIGVWATTGQILFDADGSLGALAVTDREQLARGEMMKVSVISLMDLAKRFNLSKVDFVKMDIEGSEFEVVRNCGDFLDRFRARWVIEVHNRNRVTELTRVFEAKGYSTRLINQTETHCYPLLLVEPVNFTLSQNSGFPGV